MQATENSIQISDEDRKHVFLQILADKYYTSIISEIIAEPRTAIDISEKTKIPISTVYRRLQFLQDNRLVKISGSINKDGKYFLYQSKIREINTMFNGENLEITVSSNKSYIIQ